MRTVRALSAALLACGLSVGGAAAMTFEVAPVGESAKCGYSCPEVISAVGEITSATPREFFDFVKARIGDHRVRSVVLLNSPGGSVAASMRLGMMFRRLGVAVIVARATNAEGPTATPTTGFPAGRCFSACVYALIGAKKRVVPPSSLVGIHRMSYEEYELDVYTKDTVRHRTLGSPEFVGQLASYAQSMGVSRDMIYTAERIAPENLHIVTSNELRKWNIGSQRF